MKLWHVHRPEWDYDEYDAFVIRAESAESAEAQAEIEEPAVSDGGRASRSDHTWVVDELPMVSAPSLSKLRSGHLGKVDDRREP